MPAVIAIANAIIELAPAIIGLIKLFKDAKKNGWIKDGRVLREKIQSATTDEQRLDLVRELFEHRA